MIFVVVHTLQFRFGPSIESGYSIVLEGGSVRDLARLQREVFKDPLQVGFYVVLVCAIGAHVWMGWRKAVPKLQGLDPWHRAGAVLIGQLMTLALVVGFNLGPLYAFYLQL